MFALHNVVETLHLYAWVVVMDRGIHPLLVITPEHCPDTILTSISSGVMTSSKAWPIHRYTLIIIGVYTLYIIMTPLIREVYTGSVWMVVYKGAW